MLLILVLGRGRQEDEESMIIFGCIERKRGRRKERKEKKKGRKGRRKERKNKERER